MFLLSFARRVVGRKVLFCCSRCFSEPSGLWVTLPLLSSSSSLWSWTSRDPPNLDPKPRPTCHLNATHEVIMSCLSSQPPPISSQFEHQRRLQTTLFPLTTGKVAKHTHKSLAMKKFFAYEKMARHKTVASVMWELVTFFDTNFAIPGLSTRQEHLSHRTRVFSLPSATLSFITSGRTRSSQSVLLVDSFTTEELAITNFHLIRFPNFSKTTYYRSAVAQKVALTNI